jgi:hypothetical protein
MDIAAFCTEPAMPNDELNGPLLGELWATLSFAL